MRKMLIILLVAGLVGHAHGQGQSFEWSGIFETRDAAYMWTAQKVDGKYADPEMKLAAIPASTWSDLHDMKERGKHAMESCQDLHFGGTITPGQEACYNLHFDKDQWQSLFKVNASSVSAIAFFAQHFPTEFEATAHYLKDANGEDVEPIAELPEKAATPEEDKPWGTAILASIIVNLIALVGVILCVPSIRRLAEKYEHQVLAVISGFAAGALLACTFFLLLFEATHLVATGWNDEVEQIWRWGTIILAGYLLPGLVDNVAAFAVGEAHGTACECPDSGTSERTREKADENTNGSAPNGSDVVAVDVLPGGKTHAEAFKPTLGTVVTRARLISGVLIGDFFHNFCDGIFIGAAFHGCGDSFGWGVALGTVLHEMPQEIADFTILTGPDVAFGPIKALAANFISGLSVALGALIVLAAEVDDAAIGLLLALGGGVYLQIAATEMMPRTYRANLSAKTRVAATFAFIIGAVLIGLVLLDHEHCVPSTSEGAEGGAGHH